MNIILTMLALSDKHFPNADFNLLDKAYYLNKKLKFDIVADLGDLLDNDGYSRYEKDPRLETSFADAVEMGYQHLRSLRLGNKKARILVKWGNHDERMYKYAVRNAPELVKANAIKFLPEMLRLEELGIESWGYNQRLVLEGLKITHGTMVRDLAGYSAHAELRKAGICSGISGHTHRLGFVTHRNRSWLECGHMCSKDTTKFPYLADGDADWQQGFAIGNLVEYTENRKSVRKWLMQPIEVVNGSFIVNGKLY